MPRLDVSKILKLISGGQTGADVGGLEAARLLGIPTGGTAPKGYKSAGPPSHGAKLRDVYKLAEDASADYVPRTMKNVDDAAATIAFLLKNSPGTGKTIGYAQTGRWQHGNPTAGLHVGGHRPVLVLDKADSESAAKAIEDMLTKLNPQTLNVAGHREGSMPGLEQAVKRALMRALSGKAPVNTRTALDRMLSNMHLLDEPIQDRFGIPYRSVEAAFQAAKTLDPEARKKIAALAGGSPQWHGLPAKGAGRQVKLDPNWNERRVKVMEYLLKEKFKQPKFADALKSTGGAPIVEVDPKGNDKFWAASSPLSGLNMLGRILEEIRLGLHG